MAPGSGPAAEAAIARREAKSILAESRFHASPVPRPLHGLLHTIGRALEAPLEAVEEVVDSIGAHVLGGKATVWGVFAAIVLGICGLIALRRSRRALSRPQQPPGEPAEASLSAAELERLAVAAERDGRFSDSVRLQFRAGLERLAERELVAAAPSTPNAELARAISSARFDGLAHDFDEIVYGARPAQAADAEAARREWQGLLRSLAGRRRPGRPRNPAGAR